MKGRKINCKISNILGAVVPSTNMEKTSAGLTYHKQLQPSGTSSPCWENYRLEKGTSTCMYNKQTEHQVSHP